MLRMLQLDGWGNRIYVRRKRIRRLKKVQDVGIIERLVSPSRSREIRADQRCYMIVQGM